MNKIVSDLYNSFSNEQKGFSSKKLTAFTIVLCVVAAHVKWITLGDFSQLVSVLTVDFGAISVLFGINEYGKSKQEEKSINQTNQNQNQ